MLTGRPPFCARTPLDTLQLVRTQEPVPPRRFHPETPRDLETICLKCLAKEPTKRYASALDLAGDLARFRAGKPIQARPVSSLERAGRWCRRNPVPATLLACVVFLLLVIAAGASLAAWKLDRERDRAVVHQHAAERAGEQAEEQLWNALLSQARANRWSGRAGQNFDSLVVLTRAATLHPALELRNEAIACMALPDLRLVRVWQCGFSRRFGLALDADLKRYAVSDARGTISVRSLDDNRELRRLPGSGNPVWVLQFSPDGRFLAGRCHCRNGDSDTMLVWNLAGSSASPRRLAGRFWDFHPKKALLAASYNNRLCVAKPTEFLLLLHDLSSNARPVTLSRNEPGRCLAFDPEGSRLAAASDIPLFSSGEWHYPLFIDHAATGKRLFTLRSPALLRGLAWRGDGRRLAGAAADGNVYVWQPPSDRPVKTLSGHQGVVTNVAFHGGGELLASTGWDGVVRLWDAETGRHLLSSTAASDPLRFSQDGRRLALPLDGARVGLLDLSQGHVCRILRDNADTDDGLWSAAYHPHKPLLATTSDDGVRLWDCDKGREIASVPLRHCPSALFLPDDVLLTSSESGLERWRLISGTAAEDGRARLERLPGAGSERSETRRMALSRRGQTLAVAVTERQAVLLRGDRWTERSLILPAPCASFVALSPDERWAAVATWHGDGTRIWDVRSGKQVGKELPGGDAFVAFSPDGRWLVNGTEDEYHFWEVGSWRPGLHIPRIAPGPPGPLAFTADGAILAIVPNRREVRLIETATGRQLATLAAPDPHPIRWLCFRPDGEELAVACGNRVLQLWDLRRVRERLAEMGLDWE